MVATLKALSALLAYPDAALVEAVPEIREAIAREGVLPGAPRRALHPLLTELEGSDLIDLQEGYVDLFDRTRSLSLHLFEHVHGESRDRGQAMIDLQALYGTHGLAVEASELPDHLPLFLEFLSTLPLAEAREHLGQTAHICAAIGERLAKRGSPYAAVFAALVALSATRPDDAEVATLLDEPDAAADDLAAIDAAWEDAPVTFGPGDGQGCRDGLVARLRAAKRPATGAGM
jgi:nitrate reductase delta subunit